MLRTLGAVAAALAMLLGLISSNVNAHAVSDVNPLASARWRCSRQPS